MPLVSTNNAELSRTDSFISVRACLILALFASALLLAFYAPVLWGNCDFYLSDCSHYFEPLCHFVSEAVKDGVFPLWNPLLYCGMSQAAIPSPSLFQPASYLLFLLPFSQGLAIYMLIHHLVFAVGSYLYLSCRNYSRAACLFAALCAGLSSFFFCLSRNPTLPATVAFLPLALYCQRGIAPEIDRRQFVFRVSFAFLVALTVAGGRPELMLPCLLLFLADGIISSLPDLKPDLLCRAARCIYLRLACFVLGLALAAPVLFPSLEWSALSPRAQGLDSINVFSWSASAYDFLCMLLSYPLGDLCDLSKRSQFYLVKLVLNQDALPFLTSSYLGPVVISFALVALFSVKQRKSWGILLLFLFFSVLACGSYSFLLPLLIKLFPVISMIRYPVKFLIFSELILIWAAARGFDKVLKREITFKTIVPVLVIFALLFLLSLLVLMTTAVSPEAQGTEAASWLLEANRSMSLNLLAASTEALLLALLTIAYLKSRIRDGIYASAVILLVCLNSYISASTYPEFTKTSLYNSESKLFTHLKEFLKEDRNHGQESRILPMYTDGMSVPAAYKKDEKLSLSEKYHSYLRSLGKYNSSIDFSCPQSYGYEAAATGVMSRVFKEAREHSSQFIGSHNHPKQVSDLPLFRFCKLTSTKYLLTQEKLLSDELPLPQLDEKFFELFGTSSGNNSRIYRVYDVYPRFCFAERLNFVSDWKSLEQDLAGTGTFELDASKAKIAYLLQSDKNQAEIDRLALSSAGNGHIALSKDNGQELIINLDCQSKSVLLQSDQYYPGWHAYLDGKEIPIIRANLFLRAFLIPPGRHVLRLSFMPDSLVYGLAVSAFSFLLVLLLSLAPVSRSSGAGRLPDSEP